VSNDRNRRSVVYIGHFSHPFGHGKHYRGVSSILNDDGVPEMRWRKHRQGKSGVPYINHAVNSGITIEFFVIAEFDNKDDAYAYEKAIKARGGSRYCPICNRNIKLRLGRSKSTDDEV
jgi:hypothetical protein